MKRVRVDVLVVGLGPAGASAALRAASLGLDVLAVERRRTPGQPVQCAEFVPAPLRARLPEGTVIQAIDALVSHLAEGPTHRLASPGFMISRARLDGGLARAAQDAGARLMTGARLVALADNHAVVAKRDRAIRVDYGVLIAADGPTSTVARLLSLPALPVVPARQYTLALVNARRETEVWLSRAWPGGYAWLFPRGVEAHVGLGARLAPVRLKSELDRLVFRLLAAGRVKPPVLRITGGSIPVGGLRPRLALGRVVFAGDAGGFTHPVTGAGIAPAMDAGVEAARAAHAFVGGDHKALAGFDEEMRERFGAAHARAREARALLRADRDNAAWIEAWPGFHGSAAILVEA